MVLKILLPLVASFAMPPQDPAADPDILRMGYQEWVSIADQTPDGLIHAERRFAEALTRRNNASMESVAGKERFSELQIEQMNATKRAARLSDYILVGAPGERLFGMRAERVASQTLWDVMTGVERKSNITQAYVWKTYSEALVLHKANTPKIEAFSGQGGYSVEQFFNEYSGLGKHIEKLMKWTSKASASQKQHVFAYAVIAIRLTKGDDPNAPIVIAP